MATTKNKTAAATSGLTVDRILEIAKDVLGSDVSVGPAVRHRGHAFAVGEVPVVGFDPSSMVANYPVWYSTHLRRRSKSLRTETDVRNVFSLIKEMLEKDRAEAKAREIRDQRLDAIHDALEDITTPPWCSIGANVSSQPAEPRPYTVAVTLHLPTEGQAVEMARAIAALVTTLDVTQDGSQRDTDPR